MGNILDVKQQCNGKVRYSILLEKEEMLALGGNLREIHLLPLQDYSRSAEIVGTGVQNSTKYFKIPQEISLKKSILKHLRSKQQMLISCQHDTFKNKDYYMYIVQRE